MFVGDRMKEVLAVVQRHPGGVVVNAIIRSLADFPNDLRKRSRWVAAARRLAAAGLLEPRVGAGLSAIYAATEATRTAPARQSRPCLPGSR